VEEEKEKIEKTNSTNQGILGGEEEEDEGKLLNIKELGDIPLRITVQLGNLELKIEEILKLEKGSIIGMEKLAGEPLEFFVGRKLAAKGEVVVINEKYGLRLTEIISPEESP
jgi:flagellar motor switch protein FliN